jgi:osmotically-inducible protein OsmY
MKSDAELRQDVEHELEWDPTIDDRGIAVAVADGVVSLTGQVHSLSEKWQAERAVERVAGVRAIANELDVTSEYERSDHDIARTAVQAMKWNLLVPSDQITVKVHKGWVTLTGEVHWDFRRRAAEHVVRNLAGVTGITNNIVVRPKVEPDDVKRKIEEAFKRDAILDAFHVDVEANGSEVVLRGTVRSWAERREAEQAAWSAPGVTSVRNEIVVTAAA